VMENSVGTELELSSSGSDKYMTSSVSVLGVVLGLRRGVVSSSGSDKYKKSSVSVLRVVLQPRRGGINPSLPPQESCTVKKILDTRGEMRNY
jgi:hypothetical protein